MKTGVRLNENMLLVYTIHGIIEKHESTHRAAAPYRLHSHTKQHASATKLVRNAYTKQHASANTLVRIAYTIIQKCEQAHTKCAHSSTQARPRERKKSVHNSTKMGTRIARTALRKRMRNKTSESNIRTLFNLFVTLKLLSDVNFARIQEVIV